jgi:hypothetical protein
MTASIFLRTALKYGLILTVAIGVVGSALGYVYAGTPGLVSALLGAVLTAVFMTFTAGSILVAQRATRVEPSITLFFGIILGSWLLKFVVFIIIVVLLRGQPFIEPLVFFLAIVAAVLASLVVDVIAFLRSRVPYVDDAPADGGTTHKTG